MLTKHTRWLLGLAAAVIALTLFAAPAAWAFFPPPVIGVSTGEVTPPPPPPPVIPPPPPDPFPPPCDPPPVTPCNCHGGGVQATPEPTTLVSGLIGLSILGGYALRRRIKK